MWWSAVHVAWVAGALLCCAEHPAQRRLSASSSSRSIWHPVPHCLWHCHLSIIIFAMYAPFCAEVCIVCKAVSIPKL